MTTGSFISLSRKPSGTNAKMRMAYISGKEALNLGGIGSDSDVDIRLLNLTIY